MGHVNLQHLTGLHIGLHGRRAVQGNDLAVVEQGHGVAMIGLLHIVGRHKDRHALARQLEDQVPESTAGDGIHAGGRFIQKQNARLMLYGATQGQPLLPAARQVTGQQSLLIPQTGHLQHPTFACGPALAGHVIQSGVEINILAHRQVGVKREFLAHIANRRLDTGLLPQNVEAGHSTCPRGRRQEAGQHTDGCRFT